MPNVTKRQAEAYFKAFCKRNLTDLDIESNITPPELVENFDGYRWSIYWDWADFSMPADFGGTHIPIDFPGFHAERVNSQRLALYLD